MSEHRVVGIWNSCGTFKDSKSDKFYELTQIHLSDGPDNAFILVKRYGKRGAIGRIICESFSSYVNLKAEYMKIRQSKVNKGYDFVENDAKPDMKKDSLEESLRSSLSSGMRGQELAISPIINAVIAEMIGVSITFGDFEDIEDIESVNKPQEIAPKEKESVKQKGWGAWA